MSVQSNVVHIAQKRYRDCILCWILYAMRYGQCYWIEWVSGNNNTIIVLVSTSFDSTTSRNSISLTQSHAFTRIFKIIQNTKSTTIWWLFHVWFNNQPMVWDAYFILTSNYVCLIFIIFLSSIHHFNKHSYSEYISCLVLKIAIVSYFDCFESSWNRSNNNESNEYEITYRCDSHVNITESETKNTGKTYVSVYVGCVWIFYEWKPLSSGGWVFFFHSLHVCNCWCDFCMQPI